VAIAVREAAVAGEAGEGEGEGEVLPHRSAALSRLHE
jgi:hypothetical protein